jgi:uncharacterized phage protein (TIGR02218 family)
MSYTALEASVAAGRPVRFYLFERGTDRWAYTAADRDIRLQTVDWIHTAISDDGFRQTGESSADVMKVTMPADLPVPQLYRGAPPSAEVWLTIREWHYGDADEPLNMPVVWVGSVSGVSFPESDRAEVSCEVLSSSMDRTGLRITWMRSCPHAVYQRGCFADKALHEVDATVVSLTGATIDYSSTTMLPAGRAAGGYVEWSIGGGNFEQRGIEVHAGATLTLLGGTDGLAPGTAISVFPGCDGTKTMCNDVFNNLPNHGGFDLPGKSPFDGTQAF